MLSQLYIENIAVIERVTIDFSNQLNVLTGETGAGKSILIDAINASLGQRTSRDLIRTGASSAVVSALFTEISGETEKTLESLGLTRTRTRLFCFKGRSILQVREAAGSTAVQPPFPY